MHAPIMEASRIPYITDYSYSWLIKVQKDRLLSIYLNLTTPNLLSNVLPKKKTE